MTCSAVWWHVRSGHLPTEFPHGDAVGADQHPDREDIPEQWENTDYHFQMRCRVPIISAILTVYLRTLCNASRREMEAMRP